MWISPFMYTGEVEETEGPKMVRTCSLAKEGQEELHKDEEGETRRDDDVGSLFEWTKAAKFSPLFNSFSIWVQE